jgi:hypothetical protein
MTRDQRIASFKHLHELETEGESAATPAIALARVLLIVIPVLLFTASVTFAAYYLST